MLEASIADTHLATVLSGMLGQQNLTELAALQCEQGSAL
jgi:hypothetical protein